MNAAGGAILINGAPAFGFTACNVPIGSDPFIKGYPTDK